MYSDKAGVVRYDGIQCLRAFAALLVLWAHLKFAAYVWDSKIVMSASGAAGVDLFFVISGFVISISAEHLRYDWRAFLRKRFCRVIPFYWCMSLACWLVSPELVQRTWETAVNTLLFLPLVSRGSSMPTVHQFGWTISFEVWFYLLFAVLMAAAGRRADRWLAGVLSVGCLVVALMYRGTYFLPRFLFNPLTLEFAAGVMLYRCRALLGRRSALVAGVATVAFAVSTWRTSRLGWMGTVLGHPRLGLERDLLWGGFAVSLVALTVALDQMDGARWPRTLIALGDASYSLYLIQPIALAVAAFVRIHAHAAQLFWAGTTYLLTAIVGGVWLSRTVERRITRWANRVWKGPGTASEQRFPTHDLSV